MQFQKVKAGKGLSNQPATPCPQHHGAHETGESQDSVRHCTEWRLMALNAPEAQCRKVVVLSQFSFPFSIIKKKNVVGWC